MTTYVPSYSETASATWKVLADKDSLYVGAAIQLGSNTSAVVLGTGNNFVTIDGTLAGAYGMGLGTGSLATIGSTGSIWGEIMALYSYGAGTEVWNNGKIYGGAMGIGDSGPSFSEIHNAGTIMSGQEVFQSLNAALCLRSAEATYVENTGLIRALLTGSFAIEATNTATTSIQTVINTGKIIGAISLGGGNDTYKGASGRHSSGLIDGGAGNDSLYGGADADSIVGGLNNDVLSGGAGKDVLWGDFGNDRLTGGANADVFAFTRALGSTNIDTITDFKKVDDTIYLDNAIFTALGNGKLPSALLYAAAGATHGHDSDDRIIYNTSNGRLYYDNDGRGSHAGVQFATLTGHPSIAASDFFVV